VNVLSLPRVRFTIRWPIVVGTIAVLLMAIAMAGASGQATSFSGPAAQPAGVASSDLAALAARHPRTAVEVIVQAQPGMDTGILRARIALVGGQVFREVPLIHGLAARMRAGDAATLAGMPGVRAVSLNARVISQGMIDPTKLESAYNQSIRAEKAWAAGDTGRGVGVAVIDSGLAGNYPDFRTSLINGRSRGIVSAVVNPQTADAADSYGHGTHIAGLIAGNGYARPLGDPLFGHFVGVAPQANIIAVKADNGSGSTDVLSLIDGLQFVVSHQADYNIRVVNMSVSTASTNSYRTDPLDAAVEATWLHGIVVVAAAGNLGGAADAVSHAPGNDPYVITVGGVDDQGTKDVSDDQVASWSSHGTTQDGIAKPDVLAPGAHLVAPLSPGSYYQSACPSCIVEGAYLRIGGTSMATGVVSGAIADIVGAHPDWTPDQIKATIVKRGRALTDSTGTVSGTEIALDKVLFSNNGLPAPAANQGLTPSDLIDGSTGTIKAADESWSAGSWGASSWGASSWGASSWGAAPGQWSADWAGASFTGTSLDPNAFDPGNPQHCWQLARTGFSASSWGASSWGSSDISAAKSACDDAAAAQASSWGASSWGASSWGASSWGASSWGASSWGASSWGATTGWNK
jgi:serine protease AprX